MNKELQPFVDRYLRPLWSAGVTCVPLHGGVDTDKPSGVLLLPDVDQEPRGLLAQSRAVIGNGVAMEVAYRPNDDSRRERQHLGVARRGLPGKVVGMADDCDVPEGKRSGGDESENEDKNRAVSGSGNEDGASTFSLERCMALDENTFPFVGPTQPWASPIFFPVSYPTTDLDSDPLFSTPLAAPLWQWCQWAGETCAASGKWIERPVGVGAGTQWKVRSAPGLAGRVRIDFSADMATNFRDTARLVLLTLAYGNIQDGPARETVRGKRWSRTVRLGDHGPIVVF